MRTFSLAFISNRNISLESARKHQNYTFNSPDDLKIGDILFVKQFEKLMMVTHIFKIIYSTLDYFGVPSKKRIGPNFILIKTLVNESNQVIEKGDITYKK